MLSKNPAIFLILVLIIGLAPETAFSQQPKKSSVVEQIKGKVVYIHLVQPGETLQAIAQVYDVTPRQITEMTPGLEAGDEIKANQILRIPFHSYEDSDTITDQSLKKDLMRSGAELSVNDDVDKTAQVEEAEREIEIEKHQKDRFEYHKVKMKETLYSLSKEYNVSMDNIRKVNPGLEKEIKAGQTLIIPVYLAEQEEEQRKPDKHKERAFKGKSFINYTVKPKETIFSISKKYGIAQSELLIMNPEIKKEGLKAGAKIRIPHEAAGNLERETKQVRETENIQAATKMQDSVKTVRHYKVGFLERLPGISKRQNVDLETIYKLNPGIKEEGVNWGDVIKLPRKAEIKDKEIKQREEEKTVNYITHEVMKKETLYRISKLYDVPQEDIIALNPGAGRGIQKGQLLKIPVKTPSPAEEKATAEAEPEKAEGKIMKEEQEVRCREIVPPSKTFDVALMIPFYLENYKPVDTTAVNRENRFSRSMNFIQFYEGALLALDTLEKQGVKANIHVYDVGKSRREAQEVIDRKLETMDLIIGPIYNDAFQEVMDFAQQHDVKLVNPLSDRESIIENTKNVFKVQSPPEASLRSMANYIQRYYTDSISIFIVRNNRYQMDEELEFLRKRLADRNIGLSGKNRVFEVDYSYDSLHPVLDSTKWGNRNIVVGLSKREVFTIEFVRHLNEMHDSIPDVTLFGMPEWRDFNLETSHLLNLDVHLFDNNFIDYRRPSVKWFARQFRKRFSTEPLPEKYAFTGYDVTYYFLSALDRFGNDFDACLKYHHPDLLQTEMHFIKQDSGSFENIRAFPLRYYNYRLLKLSSVPDFKAENRNQRY